MENTIFPEIIIEEGPHRIKRILKPEDTVCSLDLSRWVKSIHQREQDFEDGDIHERITEYSEYRLMEYPMSKILFDGYYDLDTDLITEFEEDYPSVDTQPPVIIGDQYIKSGLMDIVDGWHRLHLRKKLNLTHVWAFVPIESEQ